MRQINLDKPTDNLATQLERSVHVRCHRTYDNTYTRACYIWAGIKPLAFYRPFCDELIRAIER